MALPSLESPLDPCDPGAEAFLGALQGNILKAHGRSHSAHVFFRFRGPAGECRRQVRDFARDRVTSALEQHHNARAYRRSGMDGGTFGQLLLSAAGYRYLGEHGALPSDARFRSGMKVRSESFPILHDPPVEEWEPPYRGELHGMLFLADDALPTLRSAVDEVRGRFGRCADFPTIEWGRRLRRDGHDIEQFGFVDGISNPLFFTDEIEREVRARGKKHWDPAAPLGLALVREPGARAGYGSYMVFRKLEQNVRGFTTALENLADVLCLEGSARELAGALAVGRFRDGRPLMPSALPPAAEAFANDFNYLADPEGRYCPLHAHVRKNNPRGEVAREQKKSLEWERMLRIVRRGMTYGERPDLEPQAPPRRAPSLEALPESGVGLLFMSYQFQLLNFEIQQDGNDREEFLYPGVGLDPVAGQPGRPKPSAQSWPLRWPGHRETCRFFLGDFVRLLGGEYLFAPSLPFLQGLAA